MNERITGHTQLIGLMAYPIRHSSSPQMHNAAFEDLGYDYVYLAFEVGEDKIVNDHGHLTGHITDGIGFMMSLKDNDIDVIGKKMTIVGAGGVDTVEKINGQTKCKTVLYDLDDTDRLRAEMADSYLFVNATGVGMKPLEGLSVVPDAPFFYPELIVVDVPYSPLETTMRKMAKEVGCKTMNGLGMMDPPPSNCGSANPCRSDT